MRAPFFCGFISALHTAHARIVFQTQLALKAISQYGYCSAITITHFCFTSSSSSSLPTLCACYLPCRTRGNSPSVAAYSRRILHKTRPARSNQAMSSRPERQRSRTAGRRERQKDEARGVVPHLYIIHLHRTPEGHSCSGLDFDEFNLAFAQGSANALSGINESLWVSFGVKNEFSKIFVPHGINIYIYIYARVKNSFDFHDRFSNYYATTHLRDTI